jgi:hypothetical protein
VDDRLLEFLAVVVVVVDFRRVRFDVRERRQRASRLRH